MPDLSHSPLLEVLNVNGCLELRDLSEMTTDHVVIEIFRCWNLENIPILNDIATLELDVSLGDIDPESVVKNMSHRGTVHRLKLTCQRHNERRWQDPPLKILFDGPLNGQDVWHFRNREFLLSELEWQRRGYEYTLLKCPVSPRLVRFSVLSISCNLTVLPGSGFFSGVSRLEIMKCRRLRRLSDIKYLPTLENLVISECDKLESLPDINTATALKHLTIRDFRTRSKFQFLSYLCRSVSTYARMKIELPIYNFRNLVQLTLDGCVGLGGLYHWGPLPALESLLVKDCLSVTELPALRISPKLSSIIVLNCGKLREVVDIGSAKALREFRIEGCDHENSNSLSRRDKLCSELESLASSSGLLCWELEDTPWSETHGIDELIRWLRDLDGDSLHLDMFSRFGFSKFRLKHDVDLARFNDMMAKWGLNFQ